MHWLSYIKRLAWRKRKALQSSIWETRRRDDELQIDSEVHNVEFDMLSW